MRTIGFNRADGDNGYYGPFMPGAAPQEVQQNKNTAETKAKNGWLTDEMKNNLFSTGLNLASSLAQNKLNGGNQTAPGYNGAGDAGAVDTDSGGIGLWGILGIVGGIAAIAGGIWYFKTH